MLNKGRVRNGSAIFISIVSMSAIHVEL